MACFQLNKEIQFISKQKCVFNVYAFGARGEAKKAAEAQKLEKGLGGRRVAFLSRRRAPPRVAHGGSLTLASDNSF